MSTRVPSGPAVTSDSSDALAHTLKSDFPSWTTYKCPFGPTVGGGVRYNGQLKRGTDPPLFNRYKGGEHYGLHVDGSVRSVTGTREQLLTDLSCTLLMSDPDDYDGGGLEVVDNYGTHEVKLPAGDLVRYPSSSLHQVHSVTRGVRICSFFWLQNMVRDNH